MAAGSQDQLLTAIRGIVREEVQGVVGDRFERLETDVAEIKQDVSGLKEDVSGLKVDMAEVKTDISGLKEDTSNLKTRMHYLEGHVAATRGDLNDFRQASIRVLNAISEDVRELKARDN